MTRFIENKQKIATKLLFKKIIVKQFSPINEMIEISDLIEELEQRFSANLFKFISEIRIGNFPDLKKQKIVALFLNGIVFLDDYQGYKSITQGQVVKDILHEVAHSIEQSLRKELYSDKRVESEFFTKRNMLIQRLGTDFALDPNVLHIFKSEEKYDERIDNLLFSQIGYDKLSFLISGLFPNVYAITSISEYWASGMESFLLDSESSLWYACPKLFEKIKEVLTKL